MNQRRNDTNVECGIRIAEFKGEIRSPMPTTGLDPSPIHSAFRTGEGGGEVNSPGSVLWKKGAGLDYYLSAAGGFASNANKKAVSVKYANGEPRTRRRSLFFSTNPKPGPGSEVFVGARDPSERGTDYVALFGAIAQILASAVTIIVVATKL